MRRRGAFTLAEVLVALGISLLVISIVYGIFHFLYSSNSRSNLTGLTRRSSIQKDAKAGVRRLTYRLREGTQITSPPAGTTAEELVFRDIQNTDIRLRRVAAENKIISEISQGGAWVREVDPVMVTTPTGGQLPVCFPVQVSNCTAVRFTVLSGGSVVIEASIESEGAIGSLLTMVKLRNVNKAN